MQNRQQFSRDATPEQLIDALLREERSAASSAAQPTPCLTGTGLLTKARLGEAGQTADQYFRQQSSSGPATEKGLEPEDQRSTHCHQICHQCAGIRRQCRATVTNSVTNLRGMEGNEIDVWGIQGAGGALRAMFCLGS